MPRDIFNKAVLRPRPDKELMIHSNRGVQYAGKTFKAAERILFKFIKRYYNQGRKYSANGWKTPVHCEQGFSSQTKVAKSRPHFFGGRSAAALFFLQYRKGMR